METEVATSVGDRVDPGSCGRAGHLASGEPGKGGACQETN